MVQFDIREGFNGWFLPKCPIFVMYFALASGMSLAVGHHSFNASLAGNPVPTSNIWYKGSMIVSTQQIYATVGNAFAFSVKACLGIAVSCAYLQLFWQTVRQEEQETISTVDTLYSAVSDMSTIIRGKVWWKYRLLFLLAVVIWLIPFASIFTPGTLTIQNLPVQPTPSQLVQIQRMDFEKGIFNGVAWNKDLSAYELIMSPQVKRIATATAALGSVLPFTPPGPNSSWTLDFFGPALQCSSLNETDPSLYFEIRNKTLNCSSLQFMSWVPTADYVGPFASNSTDSAKCSLDSLLTGFVGPKSSPKPLTLYFAVLPPDPLDASIVQCELGNSSYDVSFNFVNGIQSVEILSGPSMNPIRDLQYWVFGEEATPRFSPSVMKSLAYEAVMEAFGRIFTGYIESKYGVTDTSILTTVVADTTEISRLLPGIENKLVGSGGLAEAYPIQDNKLYNASLAGVLEDLFRNITVNMAIPASLQSNYSAPDAPPLTNVTSETYHNVYEYSVSKLWVAYGTAIGFATLCVILGTLPFVSSGNSYSIAFSTIIRTTRHSQISVDIGAQDTGKNPLPDYIKHATITFKPIEEDEQSDVRTSMLEERNNQLHNEVEMVKIGLRPDMDNGALDGLVERLPVQ